MALPLVGAHISDAQYRRVVELLSQRQGFELGGYKDLCIRRRLAARIRAAGYRCVDAYLDFLQCDNDEQQLLLAALSVHVSSFYRNPSVFRALETRVLPELEQLNEIRGGKIHLWSIGCAHGEEPYSLALMCQRGDLIARHYSIVASDLSSEALRRARRGLYTAERLKSVSNAEKEQFFSAEMGGFRLSNQIRQQVRFFRHDILADQPFYRAELILCRNLLIYFSRQHQEQVIRKLAAALTPGGFLVLGRAETLVPGCRELFDCIDPGERIYQRCRTEGERDAR